VFVIFVQVLCYYLEIPIGHDLFLRCHSSYSTLHQLYGFLLFWEWVETEFLGTAASDESVVSSSDDEWVLSICRMVIGRGKPHCCHFIHLRLHIDYSGIEAGRPL
jgi:hypothetical protein